jgi:uncharacterized lipoprotein YddW (UPF0748 family)
MHKLMKIIVAFLISFLAIIQPTKSSYALDFDEILKDIQNLPVEKISFKKYEKLRAVQIFVLPKTPEELEAQMKIWKEVGVNTLILRVFHNEGDRYHFFLNSDIKKGVYFKTYKAPIIVDALAYFIPLAKKYGFKVFAWMTTRYADFKNGTLEKVIAYSPEKKTYYTAKGLNILSDEVQKYIISLYLDLSAYPIDGILLQDDLFLRFNEGFDHKSILRFKEETNLDVTPEMLFNTNGNGNGIKYNEHFWKWRKWKSKEIAKFVSNLSKEVKKINPSINIAVNLTYESITHPKGALAWLAHDINEFKNVSDYFSLMAYHRQIMDELKISLEDTLDYLDNMVEKSIEYFPEEPERVLFKIQIKDWKTNQAIDEKEIKRLIHSTKNLKKMSIAIVPYPPEIPYETVKNFFID